MEQVVDMAESTEAIVEKTWRFVKEGSLSQMPRMDFMFANQGTPDDIPFADAEDDLFEVFSCKSD